ncbi:MAG: hypothetical protein OEU32_11420 [Acidimicrobiia bacterium]|nr:hypothetical protein [Acidimicrobiia bacterium]
MPFVRFAAAAITLVLAAGACSSPGGSGTGDSAVAAEPSTAEQPGSAESSPAEPSEASSEQEAAPSDLPDVDVIDLATGDTVNLTSFAPSDRPIVLWFWAPH